MNNFNRRTHKKKEKLNVFYLLTDNCSLKSANSSQSLTIFNILGSRKAQN
ncbi:hypothetical protein C789_4643 [Microcystis aeruginosa FACHB-905 = DIANCHI905]|nr:hypothetical protein C789_4643 [Microcystis aeruginosa FACHB-905 = DIANCHI905]